MFEQYVNKKFSAGSRALIETMNDIIVSYMDQGYVLTVRQLYYQLVARDVIANNMKSYNQVKSLANDARLAGEMNWDAIEDRTRSFIRRTRWESGSDILKAVADQYHMDHWLGQDQRLFCVIEKEALAGVFEPICQAYDVPLLAARGYPSVSVLREFVQKDILPATENVQGVVILHLGDHDPSGIDMTRDLEERLRLLQHNDPFSMVVQRIALTMDQIEETSPPPNPAKTTDARFESYREKFGDESWELDALEPAYLTALVETHIKHRIRNKKAWARRAEQIGEVKAKLKRTATRWARDE